MKKNDAKKEIIYRLGLLQIQALLEQNKITIEQFKQLKVKLIKKYKPLIGSLEINE